MSSNSDVSTRRRVKLYMLNEERQWDDKGTGHVSATIVEGNSMALVVTSETDGSRLLESKIQHDTAYQKQQETLIVWSEGDNMDLALSFQEKTGCDDIWEKICTVQGKDPSVDITQDLIDDADDGDELEMEGAGGAGGGTGAAPGFEFPVCDLNHLLEISEMFTQVVSYPIQRERLATALERSHYLKQLIDLFHKAEDLEDEKSLHYLYEIMRAIVQFNRRNLYELIFSDEMMMDTVGILEYNPHRRVRHREFLTTIARFKEVFPMSSALRNKIQQTYRVQYIQDACMPPPSLFDDNAGSSLNSFVYLNKIDIVTKLQEDSQFSQHLFAGLASPDTSLETRRDLLGLLKEFCSIVNSLQPSQKESFFSFLSSNRALKSIFFSFKLGDDSLKSVCIDIIQIFIENQASLVREFFIADSRENNNNSNNDGLCINALIDHMIHDLDPELSNGFIITNMLKLLIDPENMINSSHKNEKQEFLNFFYKYSISHLTKPLIDLTADNQLKYDDYHTAMVMHNIVELLAFCVEFHSYNMKNYAFHNNILLRVVTLFKSQHKFVVLAALRVIRKFVSSKEEFNYRYIIKNNVLSHVVALLDRNNQYNMLNSAILELFEFIRTENIACLIVNIVENHWHSSLQHHNYVATFQLMKSRYDSTNTNGNGIIPIAGGATSGPLSGAGLGSGTGAALSCHSPSSVSSTGSVNAAGTAGPNNTSGRLRRDARALDEDEEQWYDQDDDDDEDDSESSGSDPGVSIPITVPGGTFIERAHLSSSLRSSPVSSNNNSSSGTKTSSSGGTARLLLFNQSIGNSHQSAQSQSQSQSSQISQQQISINIKSTPLTLGTVSSSSSSVPSSSSSSSSVNRTSNCDQLSSMTNNAAVDNSASEDGSGDSGHADNSSTISSTQAAPLYIDQHQIRRTCTPAVVLLVNNANGTPSAAGDAQSYSQCRRDRDKDRDAASSLCDSSSTASIDSTANSHNNNSLQDGEATVGGLLTGLVDYSSDDEDDQDTGSGSGTDSGETVCPGAPAISSSSGAGSDQQPAPEATATTAVAAATVSSTVSAGGTSSSTNSSNSSNQTSDWHGSVSSPKRLRID